jgi:hypothetical protein
MRQQQLVSFEVKHVTQMQLSASSSGIIGMVKPEHFKALEQLPYNYTLLVEGKPIACGGADWASVYLVAQVCAKIFSVHPGKADGSGG